MELPNNEMKLTSAPIANDGARLQLISVLGGRRLTPASCLGKTAWKSVNDGNGGWEPWQ
jgi:hypothetical protein